MTDTLNQLIQYGLHASGSDWTAEPSTIDLQLAENVHFWPRPEYTAIPRSGVRPANNEPITGLRGVKNMSLPDISIEVEGLSGGGATDPTDSATLSSTVDDAYTCCFGAVGTGEEADTTAATDAGSGTTITMDGTSSIVTGRFLLAKTTTGGIYQARQATNNSGTDVTICRPLTSIVGAADTADEGENVYTGKRWFTDVDAPNHTHLFFQVEHIGGYEGKFYGVMPSSASWSITHGDVLKFNMGGLMATDWEFVSPVSGGSYSAPTTGSKVVCSPVYFYVGTSLYMAHDISIDLGMTVVQRRAGSAPADHFGAVVTQFNPTISGTFYYGDQTAPAEVTEALMSAWQGTQNYSSPTFDLLVQAGDQPGAAAAWRAPNAQFTSLQRVEVDGLEAVQFTAKCTDSSDSPTATPGALMHALF